MSNIKIIIKKYTCGNARYQNSESGAVMMMSIMFFILISVIVMLGLTGPSAREYRLATDALLSRQSYFLAESETEDVYYRLKNNHPVSQTQSLVLGDSVATTNMSFLGGDAVDINSIGNVYNRQRAVDMKISGQTHSIISFGAQVGAGGIDFASSDSQLNGDLYSMGPITGVAGSSIYGSAYSASFPDLVTDQSNDVGIPPYNISFGNASLSQDITQSFVVDQNSPVNKLSLYIKKVGSPGDATVNIVTNDTTNFPGGLVIASGTLSASAVNSSYGWVDISFSQKQILSLGQTYWVVVIPAVSSGNYYIVGASGSSGNVYPNGAGKIGQMSGTWSDPVSGGSDYFFRLYQGGITGSITGNENGTTGGMNISSTSTVGIVQANSVNNINSIGTIYCTSGSGNSNSCVSHDDPNVIGYPLSDATIAGWKSDAAAGALTVGDGIISGPGITSIGPAKYSGNLTISKTVTITGTIWVTGNLTISPSKNVSLSSSYGSNSGVIVVDGKITIGSNAHVNGNGTAGSYLMLVSTNNSVDTASPAISFANNSNESALFYAPYGLIKATGSTNVPQMTAYEVSLNGTMVLNYNSLLSSLSVLSGTSTSSGYNISSWLESQ